MPKEKAPAAPPSDRPVRVGISSCLLGEEVRYDGGHKRDHFLTETFGRFVEWVPVCPEVEAGFGTPRESMRIVRASDGLRLLTVKSGVDLTEPFTRAADLRVEALTRERLSGYVLKKDSPSCGMARVKVYEEGRLPARSGRGLFAARLMERVPGLPVEEEGRLQDARLRENFIERVFAYWRLSGLFATRWTLGGLVGFHTAHKLVLMAHSPAAYQQLGRFVAGAKGMDRREIEHQYRGAFMDALEVVATPRRHSNVLQHMAGYLKQQLDAAAKTELQGAIDDYRLELVPLVVPLTLLRHYIRLHDVAYLSGQVYLQPHPKELMLRNHV